MDDATARDKDEAYQKFKDERAQPMGCHSEESSRCDQRSLYFSLMQGFYQDIEVTME